MVYTSHTTPHTENAINRQTAKLKTLSSPIHAIASLMVMGYLLMLCPQVKSRGLWILPSTANALAKNWDSYPPLSLKDARELANKERRNAIMGVKDITLGEVIDEWVQIYSRARFIN